MDAVRKSNTGLFEIPKEYRRALVLLIRKLKEQYHPKRYDCNFFGNVDKEELSGLVDDLLENNWHCHGSLYSFNSRSKKHSYLTVLSSVKRGTLKITVLESEINYRNILDSDGRVVEPEPKYNENCGK